MRKSCDVHLRHSAMRRRYTENEFDSEFFEVLQNACYQYIQSRGSATLEEIADFIKEKVICMC